MNEKNNTLPLILAFLAGVVIAAMVAFAVVKQQGPPPLRPLPRQKRSRNRRRLQIQQ